MIKHYLLNLMVLFSIFFHSCDFNDDVIEYEHIFMDNKAQVQVTQIYTQIFVIKSSHEEDE